MSSATDQLTRERLRETIELLESIAADRSVLAGVPEEERKRLLQAVANVYSPDRVERRRMAKIVDRQRKAARVKGDQGVLHETGIRSLRRKPVFHTPNVFPTVSVADGFEPKDVPPETDDRTTGVQRAPALLRLQAEVLAIHHFYDQLCPACAEFNFASAPSWPTCSGRVALLTGGRVKIGYQAGLKLLRSGAHLIVTTRFPRDSAERYAQEPDFAEWAASARDLRARPAPHAERRGVLPRAARDARPARLHHQQRVPDGAPSARLLRAHDGTARRRRSHDMPEHVRRLVGSYEGLRGYHLLPEGPG